MLSPASVLACGLIMFGIALYSIPTFDWVTSVVGKGGIAIGIVPLLLNRRQPVLAS